MLGRYYLDGKCSSYFNTRFSCHKIIISLTTQICSFFNDVYVVFFTKVWTERSDTVGNYIRFLISEVNLCSAEKMPTERSVIAFRQSNCGCQLYHWFNFFNCRIKITNLCFRSLEGKNTKISRYFFGKRKLVWCGLISEANLCSADKIANRTKRDRFHIANLWMSAITLN